MISIPPAFLAASLVIAVTPGPGVFYIVTRSVTQGRAAGLASVAGVALGNLGNAIAASLGLATLFAISTLALTTVKYVGAVYLIYLGARTIWSPSTTTPGLPMRAPLKRIFTDGFLVALFNPKTAIFFAAFVPQFLDASTATPVWTSALSVVFVLTAASTDSLYALMASTARKWVVGKPAAAHSGRFLSGGAFIALGIYTAICGRKANG